MELDYGNGYVAGGKSTDAIRIKAHSGLEFPGVDQPIENNAVLDGGVFGAGHLPARLMSVRQDFGDGSTRAQIAAAFSPGVTRTLTSDNGTSLAYRVLDLIFNSQNLTGTPDVTVVMGSDLACPEGATLTASIAGGGGWAAESIQTQNAVEDGTTGLLLTAQATSDGWELAPIQTFPSFSGRITAIQYRIRTAFAAQQAQLQVWNASAELLSTKVLSASDITLGLHKITLDAPVACSPGGTWYWGLRLFDTRGTFGIRFAYSNGDYAAGALTTPVGSGEAAGDDLTFAVYGQILNAGVGTVTFDADTDVPCAPAISCVLGFAADDLVLTGDGWTTTLHGPYAANASIVVDARNYTVTVNSVDAISDFERTGDWPEVTPGSNTITIAPAAATTVQWKPRRLGLI